MWVLRLAALQCGKVYLTGKRVLHARRLRLQAEAQPRNIPRLVGKASLSALKSGRADSLRLLRQASLAREPDGNCNDYCGAAC